MEVMLEGLRKSTRDLNLTEKEECNNDEFMLLYNTLNGSNNRSSSTIPQFHAPLPNETESLKWKLREEARSVSLKNRSRKLLSNEELTTLYNKLTTETSPKKHQSLSYVKWKLILNGLDKKFNAYFSTKTYSRLVNSENYNINSLDLFNYAMRKVWQQQTRIGLSLYDYHGNGYLREEDLEGYITDLMPTLSQLEGLEKSFYNFYCCTAVRKFMFFLDPMRTGKVKIRDILACGFLDDLLELRDEDLSLESQESNWFSASSALRVYGQYLNLDTDHNGMLSRSELARYDTGSLTRAFLDRMYEEVLTYQGEMDYRSYLEFVLALENMNEPQSLQYFFKILDANKKGYLDSFSLNYFFRDIQGQVKDKVDVEIEDVISEIFDMTKPVDPHRITLKDIVECGQGAAIVSLLIDVNGFWNYENRDFRGSQNSADT